MIYDDKQDKYFLEGEWLTANEFIVRFVKLIERNKTEMDASPDNAFYDSVRVAAGGERIKDVSFDEDESNEFKILSRDVFDLLHSARRDQIIPEHERMRFDEPLASVQDDYALTDVQRHYYQNTVVGKGSGEIVEIDWSENNYSPNQVFTNEQIDYLALQDKTFVGGTIANEINLDGLQLALNQCEITYLQELDCVVDIGKAVVADLELEIKNQVFSAELINKVNKEREWSGGIIVPETDFSEDDEFDGHDDGNVVFSV